MRLVPANPAGWAPVLKGADLGLLDRLSNHPILPFFTLRVLLACEILVTDLPRG